jgi:membrane-associated phospholipid phosphatase
MLMSAAVPLIGGAYSFANDDVEGLKQLGLECLLTAQVVTLLKNSVNRQRPDGSNKMSFPSGHAAAGFVGASYVQHRYGWVWGVPMYAIAAGVAIQRVNVKDHYWTDVFAGAAIGYAAGALFTAPYPDVWVVPTFDSKNKAVGLHFSKDFR